MREQRRLGRRAPVNEALIAIAAGIESGVLSALPSNADLQRSALGAGEVFANDAPWWRTRRTNTMARLENTVVMITGGAQGIGEGIARRLASEGAAIAIADLNGDKAKAVAETLKGEGAAGAIGVQVDVGDRGQVQAAIKAVVDNFSRLDVLFNNAGFNKPLPFLEVDEANFNSIMRVNTWGVMLGIQEGAKQMIAQGGGGKIINTASIAGRQGYAEFAPYCCSKSAVISLTQAGAREFAKHKITVNAFAPGV